MEANHEITDLTFLFVVELGLLAKKRLAFRGDRRPMQEPFERHDHATGFWLDLECEAARTSIYWVHCFE